MKVINKMAESVRNSMRSFLRIEPAQRNIFQISEILDYESNAIKNRIWFRGDADELEQLYKSMPGESNRSRFWAAVPTAGREIRKIHTGLPGIIVDTLANIVMADMNDIQLDTGREEEWKEICEDNRFYELLAEALCETLYIGDGAFKISFDSDISRYPIIEFISGENIEIRQSRGRIREVVFKTVYNSRSKSYVLYETYGYGYIRSELQSHEKPVPLNSIPETAGLAPEVTFDNSFMMAVPFSVFNSQKWKGRGKSVFDGKTDNFDAFDECWSQWMDALRKGRSKEYIPSDMLPRNPHTGEVMRPNAFDNAYIEHDVPMAEGQQQKIELVQPAIPYESYLSTYVTCLDLCLQGLISPSTLGIDVKKLDNAEAQREKEKATLYTRNKIVEAMQNIIPVLIDSVFKAWATWEKKPLEDVKAEVPFGEYANPSFESQVETVTKGKQGGIMSIEAAVEELYGDSKEELWKQEEIKRLKAEQGILEMEEPGLNLEGIEQEGDEGDAGKGNEPNVFNASDKIPEALKDSKRAGSNGNLRSGKRELR